MADQIKHYRNLRKVSARQLSDACSGLGLEISRSTLADLENGRRATLTIAELIILARALDIPPILLIFPLGRQQAVEALPGQTVDVWDAALWFAGEARLADTFDAAWLDWTDDQGIMPLYHRHEQLVDDVSHGGIWQAAVAADKPGEIDPIETAKLQRGLREELEADLRAVRDRMRDLALDPPELPAELARIDKERPRGRRR